MKNCNFNHIASSKFPKDIYEYFCLFPFDRGWINRFFVLPECCEGAIFRFTPRNSDGPMTCPYSQFYYKSCCQKGVYFSTQNNEKKKKCLQFLWRLPRTRFDINLNLNLYFFFFLLFLSNDNYTPIPFPNNFLQGPEFISFLAN